MYKETCATQHLRQIYLAWSHAKKKNLLQARGLKVLKEGKLL
jgi:hypothetical protein